MYVDINYDVYPDLRDVYDNELFRGSFENVVLKLSNALDNPEQRAEILRATEKLKDIYLDKPDIMRFKMYNPQRVFEQLSELNLEHRQFTGGIKESKAPSFITEDEIDMLMSKGSNVSGGKLRIYRYFTEHSNEKERINFLKNEYGVGGFSGGLFSELHDAKGIDFSRSDIASPLSKIHISWSSAAKRIDRLIKSERYLPKEEIEKEQDRIRQEQLVDSSSKNITFNRVGDFYEIYGEEAVEAARVLDIKLMNKTIDGERTAMTGIPAYALENYEEVLSRNGYTFDIQGDVDTLEINEESNSESNEKIEENLELNSESNEKTEEPSDFNEPKDNDIVGKEVSIDGRDFVVESIGDISGDVTLRDITFAQNTDVPVNRIEKLKTVQKLIDGQETELTEQIEQTNTELNNQEQGSENIRIQQSDNTLLYPEIPMSERHNFKITDDNLGVGTPSEKYERNINAIKLLKTLETEHRLAAPHEQEILSQYVGWGGLSECFDEQNKHYGELKSLLTDEEYSRARESTLTAFYTPPVVIRSMY